MHSCTFQLLLDHKIPFIMLDESCGKVQRLLDRPIVGDGFVRTFDRHS